MAEEVLELRRLLDRLDGHWRKEPAGVDAHGAAGAEADLAIGSTAAWLRGRRGQQRCPDRVLAQDTHHLAAEAEPVLVATTQRLDHPPPPSRRLPGPARRPRRGRAGAPPAAVGVWLASTVDGMVALDGLLEPRKPVSSSRPP